jgi:hypothetical protein
VPVHRWRAEGTTGAKVQCSTARRVLLDSLCLVVVVLLQETTLVEWRGGELESLLASAGG